MASEHQRERAGPPAARVPPSIRRLVPASLVPLLRRLAYAAPPRGDAVECPCCEGRFRAFRPAGARANAICPRCGSYERHRALWLILRRELPQLAGGAGRPTSVLHFGPEPFLQERLRRRPNLDYVSADLLDPAAMVRCDIADLPFDDGRFNVVIAVHVLEHVSDDRAALAEVRRVLGPQGTAIVNVPIAPGLAATWEDPRITDPAERARAFGQHDHVRAYGADVPERLVAAGFDVREVRLAQLLEPERFARHGLLDEPFFACRPRPAPPR